MIEVTRYDNTQLVINDELIERIEQCPETIVTFSNGKQLIVRETKEEICERAIAFRRKILNGVRWDA